MVRRSYETGVCKWYVANVHLQHNLIDATGTYTTEIPIKTTSSRHYILSSQEHVSEGQCMSIVQVISRAAENREWVDANYMNLTEEYRNRWVAVLDKAVIDNDIDLHKLSRRLRKKLADRYSEVAMEYVTKKPIVLVLVI